MRMRMRRRMSGGMMRMMRNKGRAGERGWKRAGEHAGSVLEAWLVSVLPARNRPSSIS